MTDRTGKGQPTRPDAQPDDLQAHDIPIGPGAAGVVVVPVTRLSGNPDDDARDGEAVAWVNDSEPGEPGEPRGGIGDAIRGLLRRGQVR